MKHKCIIATIQFKIRRNKHLLIGFAPIPILKSVQVESSLFELHHSRL